MPCRYFFVYGTLRRGHGNHGVLNEGRDCVYLGKATIRGSMYSLGGFPGWVRGKDGTVTGELYKVLDESVIQRMDYLEGYRDGDLSSFYRRHDDVPVMFAEDELVCSCYEINRGDIQSLRVQEIPSGDWDWHVKSRLSRSERIDVV